MPMLSTLLLLAISLFPGEHPSLAPFTAVRWEGETPVARIDGSWLVLVELNDTSLEQIVRFARREHGSKWQKRISEDLVELLADMGIEAGESVTLKVREPDSDQIRVLSDVPMTEKNRTAAWRFNLERAREREKEQAAAAGSGGQAATLSREQAERDLLALGEVMRLHHSYYRLKGVDAERLLDEIRSRLSDPVRRDAFALEVMKFLARFGDGHTRVDENPNGILPRGYLPFLVAASGKRIVAFQADRSSLVDPDHPYLLKMDGRPIEEWVEAAAVLATDGSPQFRRFQSIRNLRFLQWVRGEMGLPTGDSLSIELGAARDNRSRKLSLDVSPRKPTFGAWPRTGSRLLKDKIGYLRIDDMVDLDDEPEVAEEIRRWMDEFRSTSGLVLDVRGNGGGTRDILRLLLPYFLSPKAQPVVVNVAAKRLREGQNPSAGGYLDNRFLFEQGSSKFGKAERAAIKKAGKRFKPEWKLPAGEFSEWHWCVIVPTGEDGTYHYRKPVVVLLDGACYSATDIFLGAFRQLKNITFLGTASGGGSGRSRGFDLPESGLKLRVSSMASFTPVGRLYDGRGIEPDTVVEPGSGYFIGEDDLQLATALRKLGG